MRRWISVLAASLALASAAHALYREWGPWTPGHNISASFWPKGADALANRKERFGGHMLNAFDHFLYRGDTAALNAFLTDTAKVEGSRSVMFLGGDERVGLISPRVEDADWTMSISQNSHVGVFITADKALKLSELKLPADLPAEWYGDVGPKVKRFVAEHEARTKAAWAKE